MRNKVFILSLSLIMVLCSSFSVFASVQREVDFVEPSTSDTQGYLAVMDDTGDCAVFYWSILPFSWSEAGNRGGYPSMNVSINPDSITFTALANGAARVTLTRIVNSSKQYLCLSRQFTTSDTYTYTGMDHIMYYCYSGNIGVVVDNISGASDYLSMVWGDSSKYQEKFDDVVSELRDIDSTLNTLNTRFGTLLGYVDGIEGSIDGVEGSLSDIEDAILTLNNRFTTLLGYVDGLEGKLDDVNATLTTLNNRFTTLLGYVDGLETSLRTANETLNDISDELSAMNKAVGKQSTSSLDDSSIDDLEDDEKDVVTDKTDAIDDLDLEFGSAFGSVMDMISSAWQSHPKVFTLLIMCLTVGLIKLILNR